ncbi:phage major capsid protein [Ignavigranum ruoffiae]|uniref:phage major capsid protein n=1 Tax=Ignavigranum ruoffiae TaxID=89093 RepID=UPI002357BB48|nr:phage major capsid protein [Ignavigranum ruoffiae]
MSKALVQLQKEYREKLDRFNEIKVDQEVEMEEVRALASELKELKERIALVEDSRSFELETITPEERTVKPEQVEVRDLTIDELDKEYEQTFLRALRKPLGVKLTQRDFEVYDRVLEMRDAPTVEPHFQSAVGEDGGYIIPKSVSTMIQTYKRGLEYDLTNLVAVFRTSVPSGEFTYEKLGEIKPFVNVSEWENIPEVETPQFERKKYDIQDYAGILPIPRQLLQDTDQNLLAYVAQYIAKKTVVTRNSAILAEIAKTYSSKKALANTDDVKDILDLELDIVFRDSAQILTNQTGYNFLRKMKDKDGKYLLQPDVTQADKYTLDGHSIVVLPNRTLKDNGEKAPVFIGNFSEAITFIDRGVYEITPTTIGGDAFKRNSYDIRIIDRFGVMTTDSEAVVACEVDTSVAPDVDSEA